MAESPTVINYVSSHLGSEQVYSEFYDFNNRQKIKSIFHIVNTDGVFLASSAPADALYSILPSAISFTGLNSGPATR